MRRARRWTQVAICVVSAVASARAASAYDARLAWQPVAGAAGYRVFVRPSGQAWPAGANVGLLQADPDGVIRYVTKGLALGVLYDFAVSAYDAAAQQSVRSNVLSLLLSATPTAVGGATATRTRTSTATATRSRTSSFTATPPRTPTATVTRSRTSTFAATPVRTPTATASRTRTATATQPAPSPSRTRTATATPPPTATPTPTPTFIRGDLDVAGQVHYYSNGSTVPGVTLDLQGPSGARTTSTDGLGQFGFSALPAANWSMRPTKVGDVEGAVSALDAAQVLQAVSGTRSFDAFETLACDVTGNGTISSLDATRILQLSVALIPQLPAATTCNSDWLFVPQPLALPGGLLLPPQLSNGICDPGSIAYQPLQADASGQDYTAVLLGDCTGNWNAPAAGGAFRRAAPPPRAWLAPPRRLRAQRWAVPLHVTGRPALTALQAHVALDPALARIETVELAEARAGTLVRVGRVDGGVTALAVASAAALPVSERPVAVLIVEVEGPDGVAPPPIRLLDAVVDEVSAAVAD